MTWGRRAWEIPQERFAAAWNAAESLDGAVEAVKALADGPVPRWAVRSRAAELAAEGVELKAFAAERAEASTSA